MTSVGNVGTVAAFQPTAMRSRRVPRVACRPVAASCGDRARDVAQQAGKSLLAAAAAVSLSLSGSSALAAPTFGLKDRVADAESSYEAALARLESAFEKSQKQVAKAGETVSSVANEVSSTASKVASATSPNGQKNSVPNATQEGGKAAQPADLKQEGLNAPNPSGAIKEASREVKNSSVDTAEQADNQVSKYQDQAKAAQETPNSIGSLIEKATSAVSGDSDDKGSSEKSGIGSFFSQFGNKSPKEAAVDAVGAAASSAVVDAGKNVPGALVDKAANTAGDRASAAVDNLVNQFKN